MKTGQMSVAEIALTLYWTILAGPEKRKGIGKKMIRQAFRSLLVSKGLGQIQLVKESTLAAAVKKDNWDLYAGVLVERLPILTKPLNDLEKDFQVTRLASATITFQWIALILVICVWNFSKW